MVFRKFLSFIKESSVGAIQVLKHTLKVLKDHPEITVYPYAAAFFVSITYPLVSTTIFAHWYQRVFSNTNQLVPHRATAILGLVGFLAFYSALVAAYFTCAVSISVIAKLENRPTPPFYGILRVIKNFFRVTIFALLSIFFLPIGIIVQRRKLPAGWAGVLGSSLTLHMAQVAPSILTTPHKFGDTMRHSIDTLGRAWRESLMLKIWMYGLVFLIIVLPKLIQHGFFKGHTASNIGWIISIELGASSLVAFKVLNSIFTAVLYHEARQKK
ncbi:hypothetical protein KW794_02610 [Candidatus Saccharibacteria bacterium]|nr:hypothetical protein [Candidatus Saccharibacteria bacterium]